MPQVLIRDVAPTILRKLKARARAKRRSLQAELKEMLVRETNVDMLGARALALAIQKKLAGREFSDSGKLQAEDRGR